MNFLTRCGLVLAVATLSINAWAAELETDEQKLGYIIGMDIGKSLRDQGAEVDLESLVAAIRTTFNGEEAALTTEEATVIRQAYIEKRQAEQKAQIAAEADANLAKSQQFLAENKTKDGVLTTDSGLQYKVLTMGDGAKPTATDTVQIHYRGTFIDGTQFDSSYDRETPWSFSMDGGAVPGFIEGVGLMPIGSKFMFYIAPELAYGEGGGGPIPPNATLIFEVELLDIVTE